MATLDAGVLGRRLQRKREELGLSLRAAATQIGISPVTLMRVEKNEQDPNSITATAIRTWLGDVDCSADEDDNEFSTIEAHLRAEKNMTADVARSLALMFRLALTTEWSQPRYSGKHFRPVTVGYSSIPLHGYIRHIEYMAKSIRKMWGIDETEPLEPRELAEGLGITVATPEFVEGLSDRELHLLLEVYSDKWSAGTITLSDGRRVIIINPRHTPERIRATLMEEICHVLFDHRPTAISTVATAGQSFRDYHRDQEKEAYWVGSAVLLPYEPLADAVQKKTPVSLLSSTFGVSEEIAKFRIKVTGLWSAYSG